jgi:hypothetical protein
VTAIVEPLPRFRTLSRQEIVSGMHERGPVLGEVRRLLGGYVTRMKELERSGQVPADVLRRIAPRWPIEAVVREMLTDVARLFPANDNETDSETVG